MSSPVPIWWWASAKVESLDLDALCDFAVREDLQWTDELDDTHAIVQVRYLCGSPTMKGVELQGLAAIKSAYRGMIAPNPKLTSVYRELDGELFEVDG